MPVITTTVTPTLTVTTSEQVLHIIENWEHWDTIGLVAQKGEDTILT